MGYNHKITTNEIDTQITIPVQGTAGLQVVIGTAPVNLAENPQGAVNVPLLAQNFADAQRQLGYSDDFESYTLCQSMDASFRVFAVAPVIFINVLDPETHRTNYNTTGVMVDNLKATVTDKGILLADLEVNDQSDNLLTPEVDYIAEFNTAGDLVITLMETANTAGVGALNLSGYQLDPTAVTVSDIIGGYDTLMGQERGLELIRQVYPRFGLTPGIILAPGWSHLPEVAAVMCSKTENINGVFTCETAIDLDSRYARTYTDLQQYKEEFGVNSPHAILLWPKLKLGQKTYYYSAVWGAMTAATDANHADVPYKSPSNELLNVSAAVIFNGQEVILDTAMAEVVNSCGIVTAINDLGWRAWGNNTAAYPGTFDPKDRWIACRRMMSWYRNHFILTYKSKVDDPTNPRLIESIVDSENLYLNSLTSSGHIAGGIIEYNEEENPIESILNGTVIFHTRIAFWTPAEYIVNNIEFDPTILQNALGGAA